MLSDDLLSGADAAAKYVGLSRRVIYNLAATGSLPVVKLGGKMYFRKSELDRAFSSVR